MTKEGSEANRSKLHQGSEKINICDFQPLYVNPFDITFFSNEENCWKIKVGGKSNGSLFPYKLVVQWNSNIPGLCSIFLNIFTSRPFYIFTSEPNKMDGGLSKFIPPSGNNDPGDRDDQSDHNDQNTANSHPRQNAGRGRNKFYIFVC